MSQIQSKQLLIVGATSSLSPSIVAEAHNRGYQVTGTSRSKDKRFQEINEWLDLDIAEVKLIEKFKSNIEDRQFDLIIYLVGATNPKRNSMNEYIETYFTNTILLIETLTKTLSTKTSATFMYLSSRSAIYPSFDVFYSATKSGVSAALRSLGANDKNGNKYFSIAPGLIKESTMFQEMSTEIREKHVSRSGDSLLSTDELAQLIFGVLDDRDSFKNGQIIEIGPSYE
jgi:short-subunit dehydrogenase